MDVVGGDVIVLFAPHVRLNNLNKVSHLPG